MNRLGLRGFFTMRLNGKLVAAFHNGIVNEGLDTILNVHMYTTAKKSWYMGLIDSSSATLANNDTLASHAGWTEFTDYTGSRQALTCGASNGQIISTSSSCTFTISDSGIVCGAFLASVSSGTSGILWSTGTFGNAVTVASTNVITVDYSLTAGRG